nr:restriction endonuclease subunit M [Rubrobacter sp.]
VYSLIPSVSSEAAKLYWLGILNSKIMWWFLKNTGNVLRGGYFRFKTNYLNPFPIRTIDFPDPDDVARHDRMVELVERMLSLHERLAGARIGRERTVIGHQIEATDRQIDRLVYELYGLTDEEIGLVEGATAR